MIYNISSFLYQYFAHKGNDAEFVAAEPKPVIIHDNKKDK